MCRCAKHIIIAIKHTIIAIKHIIIAIFIIDLLPIIFCCEVKSMIKYKPSCTKGLMQIVLLCIIAITVASASDEGSICQQIISSIRQNNESQLESNMQKLQDESHFDCVLQLFPRYFWAQNMSHILVKFEFLNSADTSACERVLSVSKLVEHNKISLALVCLQSNLIIRYRISVTTLMPLNFYHASWKQAQQNTIILQCLKSPNPYFWKTLYLPSNEPPRKPKIWWKMVEKYMENTKKFIYDLQVEEEQFDVSSYVKKRKGKKSKQLRQFQPNSRRYFYCNQNNPFELGSWLS